MPWSKVSKIVGFAFTIFFIWGCILSAPLVSADLSLWIELDVYFYATSFSGEEDVVIPQEWHVFNRLHGALSMPSLEGGKADFLPGEREINAWGIHFCPDEEEGFLVQRLLTPGIERISEGEFFWNHDRGEVQLVFETQRLFLEGEKCPFTGCSFTIPPAIPPDGLLGSLVLISAREEEWNLIHRENRSLPIRVFQQVGEIAVMITGQVKTLSEQKFIEGEGKVDKRIIHLLRSPHLASSISAEAFYGESYTVRDVWRDSKDNTWLLFDMGDGRQGWYRP